VGEVAGGRDQPFNWMEIRMAAVYDGDGRLHSMIHYLQPRPPAMAEAVPLPVHATPPSPEPQTTPAVAPDGQQEPARIFRQRLIPLLSTDVQGRIASWTEEAATFFGYPAEEAMGRPLHPLFRPSDATGFHSETQALLATPGQTVSWPWFGKNGAKGIQSFQFQPQDEGQMALTLLLDSGEVEEPQVPEPHAVTEPTTGTYVFGPSITHPWPVADLEREQLLLTEAHHRIKNHLQIISSLLNLQSNNLEDATARQALRSSQNRVRAIASLHQHLYQLSLGGETSLQEFTDELVARLRECYDAPADRVAVAVHLEQCEVRDEWHMPLALILNEAISNAFKHAFPDGRNGTIDIKLTAIDREAHLAIQDDGIGLPADFDGSATPGLGLKVIGVFAEQMRGKVSLENITDRGLIFDLRFPIGCVDN
jgi:two-component sensor histidine kinase